MKKMDTSFSGLFWSLFFSPKILVSFDLPFRSTACRFELRSPRIAKLKVVPWTGALGGEVGQICRDHFGFWGTPSPIGFYKSSFGIFWGTGEKVFFPICSFSPIELFGVALPDPE